MKDLPLLIQKVSQETGVDPRVLAALVNQESRGNPNARSPAGAMGLSQLMPGTARQLGVKDPWNPEENLRGGARYFKQQLDKFGSVPLALAAYNAGPGNVSKHKGIPPFKETKNYVSKIMAALGEPTDSPSFEPSQPNQFRPSKRTVVAQKEEPDSQEFFGNLMSFLGGQEERPDDFDSLLKIILG